MNRSTFNFFLALEGVGTNKLRGFLTALGIVFGVAAVIAMLAIGTGAKQSILEQMKLIGTNNVVIKAVVQTEEEKDTKKASNTSKPGEEGKLPLVPGLTMEDSRAINSIIPGIESISPEIVLPVSVIRDAKLEKAKCIGVTNAFFALNNMEIAEGNYFHSSHMDGGVPVCIIGKSVQAKFFSQQNPIGQKIKCGTTWLTVIGVLQKRIASGESLEQLGIRDYNADIYIPVPTAFLRFKNRAKISKADLGDNNNDEKKSDNYHQLDRITVQLKDSKYLQASADVIGRMLKRRHHEVLDYEIEIPELLLKQQQKTQDTFNLVLAAIAGISLLVGGIGIMNIMLASVLERIKEIGVRRSMGATQNDIVLQFLFEAIIISLTGGLVGVILGVVAAKIVSNGFKIPTVIPLWSVFLSFGVAAAIGIIFGLFPARKAAMEDPVKSLRTE